MPLDRGYNRYGLECGLRSVEEVIDPRIGQRFKEAREGIGLTQEELAEITGYSVNYISTVERGVSFPRCERLITLMNTLSVSADSIFCDVLENTVSLMREIWSGKSFTPFPHKLKNVFSTRLIFSSNRNSPGSSESRILFTECGLFSLANS